MTEDNYDLDEDIFGFEQIQQAPLEIGGEEESLEAIFATFQSDEDARAAELESAHASDHDEFDEDAEDSDFPDLAFSDEEFESDEESQPEVSPAQPAVVSSSPSPTAPAADPAQAAPLAKQSMSIGAFSKSALLILISVTLLNGMVGFVILRQSSDIMKNVSNTGTSLMNTADQIKRNTLESTRKSLKDGVGLPQWDVENHPTFEVASQDIKAGNYQEARRRLSSFLALIDGIDPSVREEMEARAKLMIASSIQQEALALALEQD